MIVLHKILIRVSGLHDNGSTPLQGQQDEHPEQVNIPRNAIDDNVVDNDIIFSMVTRHK